MVYLSKKKLKTLCIFLAIASLWSCERDFDLEEVAKDKTWIVNAWLQKEQPVQIKLSRPKANANAAFEPIEDAQVKLLANDGSTINCSFTGTDYIAEQLLVEDKWYTVVAEKNDTLISATDRIPPTLVLQDANVQFNTSNTRFQAVLQPPNDKELAYKITVYQDDLLAQVQPFTLSFENEAGIITSRNNVSQALISNEILSGMGKVRMKIYYPNGVGFFAVKVDMLSDHGYKYLSSLSQQFDMSTNASYLPLINYSNVVNGKGTCIGINTTVKSFQR